MSQQGSEVRIIFGTQAAFATAATECQVLPFTSESLRLSRNLISSATIRSDRNPQPPVRGNVDVAGDVNFELAPQHGKLFTHALGVCASGVAGTYTYTIGSLPTGLTFEKQFTQITDAERYWQYIGCKINSLRMNFKSEGMIECSVSVMGAKETLATSSADAAPDDFGHDPFDGFQATVTDKDDVTLGSITEIDFTIENNLDGSMYVMDGTGQRKSIPAGTAKVTGNLKALFENSTLYNRAINHTESSIKIIMKRGTGAGTAGNEQLTILMSEIVYHPQAPVVAGPQGVMVELPFEAYYRDSGASPAGALTMELKASEAYY